MITDQTTAERCRRADWNTPASHINPSWTYDVAVAFGQPTAPCVGCGKLLAIPYAENYRGELACSKCRSPLWLERFIDGGL